MPRLSEQPTWVYELTDFDATVLYIGIAVDVDRRLAQHRATKHWWSDVHFVTCARYANRVQALAVEAHAIATRDPVYNVQGVPQPPPYVEIGRRNYINPPTGLVLEGVQRDWR